MFQFSPLAPVSLCIQERVTRHDSRRVSPFGHPRITAYVRLPEAFRSLSRPSSPVHAKASTVRPCSLDRIYAHTSFDAWPKPGPPSFLDTSTLVLASSLSTTYTQLPSTQVFKQLVCGFNRFAAEPYNLAVRLAFVNGSLPIPLPPVARLAAGHRSRRPVYQPPNPVSTGDLGGNLPNARSNTQSASPSREGREPAIPAA